jgi:hypothetical protein
MTMASPLAAYRAARADIVQDRPRILALWSQGLSHRSRPDSKFDWYYDGNPEGPPVVVFLLHGPGNEPVGVASAGRRRMRIGDEVVSAGTLVDFVVAPQHRALFPAIALQKDLRERAQQMFGVTFALPNLGASAAIGRAGYRLIGHMVRRARVLRSAAYLARHLPAGISGAAGALVDLVRLAAARLRALARPGFRALWLDRPDSRFDDFWQRAVPCDVLVGIRDSSFLMWRFVRCPLHAHSIFALLSTANQSLVGYAVCEREGRTLYVRDFLVDRAVPGAWPRFWLELYRAAFQARHDALSVEFFGAEEIQHDLASVGMIERQRRPFYATVSGRWAGVARPQCWYITQADEDG